MPQTLKKIHLNAKGQFKSEFNLAPKSHQCYSATSNLSPILRLKVHPLGSSGIQIPPFLQIRNYFTLNQVNKGKNSVKGNEYRRRFEGSDGSTKRTGMCHLSWGPTANNSRLFMQRAPPAMPGMQKQNFGAVSGVQAEFCRSTSNQKSSGRKNDWEIDVIKCRAKNKQLSDSAKIWVPASRAANFSSEGTMVPCFSRTPCFDWSKPRTIIAKKNYNLPRSINQFETGSTPFESRW